MPITFHRAPAGAGRRTRRLLLAALSVAAVAAGGLAAAGPANAAPADTSYSVSDASFTWGLSAQANIYQYGQCNFLSAGTAGDNGQSVAWTTQAPGPGYQAADGNVSILKPDADDALAPVDGSLADTCTDANGAALANGASSGTVVRFANGTGSIDPIANTASVTWAGSFTSVFYNGLIYWSATNPKLTVASDGTGTLTATLSGYGSSRTGTPAWFPVPTTTATLATLHGVHVTRTGFVVTPDFAGVVDTSDGTTQKQTATGWGSWPQSFIAFANPVGIAPFFYTSSATDAQTVKAPLPITFAYTTTSAPITSDDATLVWAGNAEIQSAPPFNGSNYFSAGASDGTQATYQAEAGDVRILQRASDGSTTPASYATRAAFIAAGGTQLVELDNGHAVLAADGSGTVDWTGSFSVNFYGGLVPFTVTDPELTVDADGDATLTGTLSGWGSSMSDPTVKTPLDPQPDTVIATLSNVHLGLGDNTLTPDYAGVAITVPSGQTAQDISSTGWGSWPQSWVDYQFQTGLSSYWYSSGGAADAKKAPSAFTVTLPAPDGTTPPPVGGGTTTPPPADTPTTPPPVDTPAPSVLNGSVPTITGTAKVGATLTAKAGVWGPVPVTTTFQWYASGKAIAGAKSSKLALKAAQYGKTITVKVTGSAAGYPTLVEPSKATKKVAAGKLRTAAVKVSGTAKVGKRLTAKVSAKSWTPGTKLSYQWYAGTKAVKGATKSTFTPKAAQKGKTIKVKVTGKRTGYVTTAKVSKTTKKVAAK